MCSRMFVSPKDEDDMDQNNDVVVALGLPALIRDFQPKRAPLRLVLREYGVAL